MDILALKAARNILHDNPEAAAAARRAREGEYKGQKEMFNMNGADYGRLEKLIKMNENRIRSRRRDIGKSKEQLMIEKVEAIIRAKKSQFLEQRVESSEMTTVNKLAKLGDEYTLQNTIWQMNYYVDRRCMVTGRTMLHEAAGAGQLHVVRMLCREFKANVNVPTVMGKSVAIHLAAAGGYRQIVAMLITHGADVNAVDAQRNTPLHYCNKLNVMKTLLRFGADGAVKNRQGKTPAAYYEMMTAPHDIDPLVLAELQRRSNHAFLRQLGLKDEVLDDGGDSDDDRPATRANQVRRRKPGG